MFSHFLRKVSPFGWRVTAGPTHAARAAGRVWHLTPDAADVLGPAAPDLDAWLRDARTEVVKTGPHRTVYRVPLPGGMVYVKHCRITGPRAWAREVLRPAKARLEFENALALRDRGIPAVVPLAWGCPDSRWPGESYLVTRSRDGVVPFVEFVERVLPALPAELQTGVRRQLAHALGGFMARLHDAGVAHPDPHAGNILVELPPSHVLRFYLIDLHAVRIGRPLSWAESRANLVLYNRWFQLRASRADRLRFWHSYRRNRRTLPTTAPRHECDQAREVERQTVASNLRFWAGRESRCVGKNRYFRPVRCGSVRGFAVRDLPDDVLLDLLADPDALFAQPGVKLLKDSRTSTVAELTLLTPDGPRAVVLKRVSVRRWFEPLQNLLRRSAVLRSWVAGHSLRDRWLPTPRPLVVLHRYRRGLPAEGYILVDKVPDAVGLPEAVAALSERDASEPHAAALLFPPPLRGRVRVGGEAPSPVPPPTLTLPLKGGGDQTAPLTACEFRPEVVLRAWLHQLARTLRAMHDRSVSHRDLKATNVMLAGGTTPVLIDLVGVRTGAAVPFRQRAKELARLNVSFLSSPAVPRGERLRFLRAYLVAGPATRGGWKTWWKAIAAATAAKVAKNRRTGRPLG